MTNEVSLNAAKNMLEDFVCEMNARSGSTFKIKSHQVKTVYVNSGEALGRATQEAIPSMNSLLKQTVRKDIP